MRRLGAVLGAIAMILASIGPASSSGYYGPYTYMVDQGGGSRSELEALYAGRLGIVLPSSPRRLLYLQWRLLNGLEVGAETGAALTRPCCDERPSEDPDQGTEGWLHLAREIGGADAAPDYISTELAGPDYTSVPNCFSDAFDTAIATLKDRAARFGRRSPAVIAWLKTQKAVFESCGRGDVAFPAPIANAPAWLSADRVYQEAAFALYNGRNIEAAERFGAIARDSGSPWRPKALYLKARAMQRQALVVKSGPSFAAARAAIDQLAAAPAGTYGQGEIRKMRRTLAYLDQPDTLFALLDRELRQREPAPGLAAGLRDYLSLGERIEAKPDLLDWLDTIRSNEREKALGHARERWASTANISWLVAALSLVRPGEAAAAALAADAAKVGKDSPGWLTAQYHEIRLTAADADPSRLRQRLDAILARDLAGSDRNVFLSLRTQLSTDLADFMRHAIRIPYCVDEDGPCNARSWAIEQDGGVARDPRTGRYVAFGADARAILDRLPLTTRIEAAHSPRLPAELRLDLTLTNYGRAVQLQDDKAIDRLSGDLAGMMPLMRSDWRAIVGRRPGPAKRFAELFVLAKIPGMSSDLDGYTRPAGTVASYQGQWWEWMIAPRGRAAGPAEFPALRSYNDEHYWAGGAIGDETYEDLTCFGKCGGGASLLKLPAFAAAGEERARAERAAFLFRSSEDEPGQGEAKPDPMPPGAISAWEELLAYARAHPRDPRSAEALYWLVRIGRWGVQHDRIGYRAFRLLHTRHPGSAWTARSPYYYD